MRKFVIPLALVFVLAFSGCIQGAQEQVGCPEDARLCPDTGSMIVRIPPDCEFEPCPVPLISKDEATAIAAASECMDEGTLTENVFYNENTRTWWIDLDLFEENELCNPACVVDEETETASINWRCTGAIPP